ncbi:2-hydroxychromene-2-carboxylate isomerase [Phaeovulum vinaykumarii]|uniref:2-hydroxychromene-2-carboxylate isomerase n=1 Tax=Phaeovulum vinaykumarii TaxID=407234 RepID=A0A1N7JMS1_9RHOB|nr:2-hydroxychromene-2-carboxylate isomerase [Phaeovulum vinaykumarii]SIS50659.1 2-hydroxychromene-2-carboxylate isomerase [Phaeovulum vinaykumarii]SOB90361.1 2-hydroxychromene-2-carboxylate isomerase [Phaeovulum vinaykumarii]
MARIDYFFSTLSPWTYLAGTRAEEIAARHGAEIRYHPLDLMALFDRTGGTRPAERHPNRMVYRGQELARWSRLLGMAINVAPRHWPTNPAPSSYAIIAAQAARDKGATGDLGGLCHAILRATWAEEKDIAEDDVIRAALEANGFDGGLVSSGLFIGAETYARNLDLAVERGVFGSPFYILAETDERFWGQDRLALLDAALAGAAA